MQRKLTAEQIAQAGAALDRRKQQQRDIIIANGVMATAETLMRRLSPSVGHAVAIPLSLAARFAVESTSSAVEAAEGTEEAERLEYVHKHFLEDAEKCWVDQLEKYRQARKETQMASGMQQQLAEQLKKAVPGATVLVKPIDGAGQTVMTADAEDPLDGPAPTEEEIAAAAGDAPPKLEVVPNGSASEVTKEEPTQDA